MKRLSRYSIGTIAFVIVYLIVMGAWYYLIVS